MQLALIDSIKIALHLTVKCKQECFPVGCVPSAAVAVRGVGGVCLSLGWVPAQGWVGVCLEGCVCPGGYLHRGVSAQGVFAWGCLPGRCLPRGVLILLIFCKMLVSTRFCGVCAR